MAAVRPGFRPSPGRVNQPARQHGNVPGRQRGRSSFPATTGDASPSTSSPWEEGPPPPPPAAAWSSPPWFTCCVCDGPLKPSTSTARYPPLTCPAGHSFDRAKEGHVFLLPTGRKKRESAGPAGDAEAQVRARRSFFDAGFYDPILAAAADAVCGVLRRKEGGEGASPVVLDAGCGEGAYLHALSTHPSLPPPTTLLGIDVSKPAIRLGASRYGSERLRFAVASSFAFPLEGASVDCVLVAMAPAPPPGELQRVLVPKTGALVVVRPGPLHLDGLRRAVYGDKARFEEEGGGKGGGGAGGGGPPGTGAALSSTRLTFSLSLPGPAAVDLLGMTPYAWSARRGLAERLAEEGLETRADVWVEAWGVG